MIEIFDVKSWLMHDGSTVIINSLSLVNIAHKISPSIDWRMLIIMRDCLWIFLVIIVSEGSTLIYAFYHNLTKTLVRLQAYV